MRVPVLFLFLTNVHVFAQPPICVNRDASPSNQMFINQFANAPDGSFIAEWKKTQTTEAEVCTDCIQNSQSVLLKLKPIPLETTQLTDQDIAQEETEPELEIRRTIFGRNYYVKDGKRVYLSQQEAFEIKDRQRQKRLNNRLQQEIAESTQREINKRMREQRERKAKEIEDHNSRAIQLSINESAEYDTNIINPACVERTLNKLRPSGTKRFCNDDRGSGTPMSSIPCITKEITEYLAWSMTKAFECINNPSEPLDANLFFKKINRESNFNFWIENKNTGRGLGQMTFPGMQEVMGGDYDLLNRRHYKHAGRNMLEQILKSNPACKRYHSIANPDLPASESMYPRPYNYNKCAQLSMDEGIQRNLLASIALYRFYRDEQKIYSSHKVLQDLGIPTTNPDYVQMKNLLALLSYSSTSPQGARRIALSLAGQMNPSMTYEQFRVIIKRHPRARYLRDIDNSFEGIKKTGEVLTCTGLQ